jgi:hypothetical protein
VFLASIIVFSDSTAHIFAALAPLIRDPWCIEVTAMEKLADSGKDKKGVSSPAGVRYPWLWSPNVAPPSGLHVKKFHQKTGAVRFGSGGSTGLHL